MFPACSGRRVGLAPPSESCRKVVALRYWRDAHVSVRDLEWSATPSWGRLKVGRAPPYGQAGMLVPTIRRIRAQGGSGARSLRKRRRRAAKRWLPDRVVRGGGDRGSGGERRPPSRKRWRSGSGGVCLFRNGRGVASRGAGLLVRRGSSRGRPSVAPSAWSRGGGLMDCDRADGAPAACFVAWRASP